MRATLFLFFYIGIAVQIYGQEFMHLQNKVVGDGDVGKFGAGLYYWTHIGRKPSFFQKVIAIADTLNWTGKTDAAVYWYRIAFPYGITEDKRLRANAYNRLAQVFLSMGNYEQALYMYYRAYKFAPEQEERARILINSSNVHIGLQNYNKALEILEKSLPILKNHKSYVWVAINLGSQALIYRKLERLEKAMRINKEAYKAVLLFRENGNASAGEIFDAMNVRNSISNNIADLYLELKQTDSAYVYLNNTREDFDDLPMYTKACIQLTFGNYFLQKGMTEAAVKYLLSGLEVIKESEYKDIQAQTSKALTEAYLAKKKYEKAFYWQSKYTQLKDSLTSFENIHRVNALETQYYLSQKDKILAEKELKITQQTNKLQRRNWMAFTSVLLAAAVLLILIVSRKSYRNKQKLLKTELKHSRQQQKLARMEAMIDGETKERTRIARELHDSVVNEVLALKLSLTDLGKDFSTLRFTPKFKRIVHQSEEVAMRLRETAHNLLPAKIRENGLFNTIGSFIEKINASVHFTFQHYGNLPALDTDAERIILLCVLELIQNILKHARASEALVQLNYFEDVLSITVEDNGVGLRPEGQHRDDKGIGLQGIIENMEMLGAVIDFQSGEYTGTTVLIEIPLAGFKLQREDLRDAI